MCQSSPTKPRSIKSRSNGHKRQALAHSNGYDQLEGEWLAYYNVASRFTSRVKAEDKEDILHTIIMTLADVERNNGHNPFTEAVMYRIASRTVADYWRTRRYDTYHSWGWTSSVSSNLTLKSRETTTGDRVPSEGALATHTVENRLKTDVILIRGEFVGADIPVLVQTLSADESTLKAPAASTDQRPLAKAVHTGDREEDIVAVVSTRMLAPYRRYSVTVSLTPVTEGQMLQADKEYPSGIGNHYLQLPYSLPERVRLLSRELTQGMETPYEKVTAIKGFLNEFKYDTTTEVPPEGTDAVDSFLFSDRRGDCLNFASAMVVMLRSADVPARLCTGYLRGEQNKDTGELILRAKDYHAWAEVYFPGYGWAEIETTSMSESIYLEEIISVGSPSP